VYTGIQSVRGGIRTHRGGIRAHRGGIRAHRGGIRAHRGGSGHTALSTFGVARHKSIYFTCAQWESYLSHLVIVAMPLTVGGVIVICAHLVLYRAADGQVCIPIQ
jgi:hypothetical protein